VDDVGILQNLPTVDKSAYAVDILRNRKDYILVQIESKHGVNNKCFVVDDD